MDLENKLQSKKAELVSLKKTHEKVKSFNYPHFVKNVVLKWRSDLCKLSEYIFQFSHFLNSSEPVQILKTTQDFSFRSI